MKHHLVIPLVVFGCLFVSGASSAEMQTVRSPDGQLSVKLELREGKPTWSVAFAGNLLLSPGHLGVSIDGDRAAPYSHVSQATNTNREQVKTTWGKFAEYDDHYNELRWTLNASAGRTIIIVVRVYDQGLGIRYEFPVDGGWGETIKLTAADTEFCFASDATGWCYNRERDPIGPQPLSKFHGGKGMDLPLTVKCDSAYVGVLEAAIFDQAPYRLNPLPTAATAFRETFSTSTLPAGGKTSWRVVLVGKQPGDLLTSPVMYCLNPPCQIENTEWIRPGLAFWDWRAWGAQTKDGFKYELDMASWRRFIDFASKNNVRYLVLDANWYGPEFLAESDPRTSRDHLVIQPDMTKPGIIRRPAPPDWEEPIDVPALIRYAKQRNVGIILYINDLARDNYPFEETLALYQQWGAAGIKYGFMKAKGQAKVQQTREIVKLCAQHQLLCNFHDGPVPPSGDERTYPNYITREFCHSQSDAMRAFSPSGFCEQVFVNMLAGPLDMCNGLYTLVNPARDRPRIFTNIDSTVVAETARVMIVYSGMSLLPDTPEAYAAKGDLFDFLRRLPMTWDETRILHGSIGEYITTARREGNRWFIASATNDSGRTLEIATDFLTPGKSYTATLYEDAPDAHFQSNRESYQVRKLIIEGGDVISARMAPGGGHCVYLEPAPADVSASGDVDPAEWLDRLKRRDAELNNRSLQIEQQWSERVSPRAQLAASRFNAKRFGQPAREMPPDDEIPADFEQPHRLRYLLTVRSPEVTLERLEELAEIKHPRFVALQNKGFRWSTVGGVERSYSPETRTLHESGAPKPGGVLQSYQWMFEWCCGFGFAKNMKEIHAVRRDDGRVIVNGKTCLMGYDDSRIELELDQDLIVRRGLISVPAKSGGGFNVYAVRTTGTVRPDGCVPVAQRGNYRRILRPKGKPESVYKEFDVEFVEISAPLTDEQYAGRTSIVPGPDTRKVMR